MGFLDFVSDYWNVVKEIQRLCKTSSSSAPKYMKGKADRFGGNFGVQDRLSYFSNENNTVGIPCGFLKKLPISNPG